MAQAKNYSKQLDKVGALWGQLAKDVEQRRYVSWMVHPFIEKYYINLQVSGDPDENWLIYIKNKYLPKQLNWGVNLGCGDGGLERHAVSSKICDRFDAFDIADDAIKIANNKSAELGLIDKIKYDVADINNIQLQENKYDIAFFSMSAHHFIQLEHIFTQVKKALKPKGLIVLYEFVGPSQFQWTDKQLTMINEILDILPTKYKQNISMPGQMKDREARPTLEWMNQYDPSEAIRSSDIYPILQNFFDIIEKIDYGGTLLHMLLKDIVGNFNIDREEDMSFLKLLCFIEKTLIREKVISSDFALIIARNN